LLVPAQKLQLRCVLGAMCRRRAGGVQSAWQWRPPTSTPPALDPFHRPPPLLQRALPKDVEQQLLDLLQQFKEARAAWDAQCAAAAAEEAEDEQHEGLELEDDEHEQVCACGNPEGNVLTSHRLGRGMQMLSPALASWRVPRHPGHSPARVPLPVQEYGARTNDGQPFSAQLVVHNAVLNSLVELG